jgi:hypothetical protein
LVPDSAIGNDFKAAAETASVLAARFADEYAAQYDLVM